MICTTPAEVCVSSGTRYSSTYTLVSRALCRATYESSWANSSCHLNACTWQGTILHRKRYLIWGIRGTYQSLPCLRCLVIPLYGAICRVQPPCMQSSSQTEMFSGLSLTDEQSIMWYIFTAFSGLGDDIQIRRHPMCCEPLKFSHTHQSTKCCNLSALYTQGNGTCRIKSWWG